MARLEHTFRLGFCHPERTYRMASGGLEWQDRSGRGYVPYNEIDHIHIFKVRKFGVGGQTRALVSRCVVRARGGEAIILAQDHYIRFGVGEDRLRSFQFFTNVLVARVSTANPQVSITHGQLSRSPGRGVATARAAALGLMILRRLNPERTAAIAGSIMRAVGPWIPEHRVGRENLVTAFPEKSSAEVEDILRGVWDNYGRVCVEIAHLDRIDVGLGSNPDGKIVMDARTIGYFKQGKSALLFATHLANWEAPASVGRAFGLDIVVPVRRQHLDLIANFLAQARPGAAGTYIPVGSDTPFKLKSAVDRGACIAFIVDQHIADGIDVVFFGRSCKVSPVLARLARALEWPIMGIRTIRLPDQRLRVEVVGPIEPSRDIDGRIDVTNTMQAIMSIVEGWVREHPDQWLCFIAAGAKACFLPGYLALW
jgi:Kdo2-lipid IVA lauroyltransferase/acyltransferase